ncbi:MAG TPA: VWA domain-containing protein [Bacteroidales bacterium]|jgi:Mg-chelatase subunit ChlD
MLRFAHTYYFIGLLALPFFMVLFWMMRSWKKRALVNFGRAGNIQRLMPDISVSRPYWKFVMLILAYISLIIGLADPQIGSKLEKIKRRGVDLIIALDVSNSMLAQDIKPNRLERAKQAISKLIDNLENDRIGLIVFAGKAYTQMPITTDYAAAKLFLSTINPGQIPVQGTAIGEAIDQGIQSFGSSKQSKAIILITDGENHEDDAVAKAHEAAAKSIAVYTIGMGLPEGAPIPIYNAGMQIGYKKDQDGNTIITRLDEKMLQDIANAGNGIFVRANNTQAGLKKVFDEVNKMQKSEYDSQVFSDYEDRYQLFLLIALLLLLGEIFIFERKGKWAERFRIFGPKTPPIQ